jgi:hypothetical protein
MSRLGNKALPVELWLLVFSFFGADATLKDWMRARLVCKRCSENVGVAFTEWLLSQRAGERFCPFEGDAAELRYAHECVGGTTRLLSSKMAVC